MLVHRRHELTEDDRKLLDALHKGIDLLQRGIVLLLALATIGMFLFSIYIALNGLK